MNWWGVLLVHELGHPTPSPCAKAIDLQVGTLLEHKHHLAFLDFNHAITPVDGMGTSVYSPTNDIVCMPRILGTQTQPRTGLRPTAGPRPRPAPKPKPRPKLKPGPKP